MLASNCFFSKVHLCCIVSIAKIYATTHANLSLYIYFLFCFPPRFPFSHNMIGWNLCDNLQFSSKFRKLMHGNREKKNWKKKSKWNDVITYSVELELVLCSGQESWLGIFWEMLIFCVSNYDDIYQRPNEMQRLSSIRQERKKISTNGQTTKLYV